MERPIVILHSLYPPDIIGGAEISTQILADTLAAHLPVYVIVVGSQHRKVGVIKEKINQVSVIRLPYNNVFWMGNQNNKSVISKVLWRMIDIYNVYQYREVKRLLKKIKPVLIHTQNLPGLSLGIWSAAYELNIPIVHTLRDYSLLTPLPKHQFFSFFYQKIAKKYSKYVSAVIGISEFVLERHTEKGFFQNAKKYVIPNSVKGNVCLPNKEIKEDKPLTIGYFGQLTPHKGVNYLISAVKSLSHEVVSKLYICGDGPSKEELVKLAGRDNRIIFTGKLNPYAVKDIMTKVDLTIFPSIWEEPFGRVIIESYQVGTPVYASRTGGIPEVIIDQNFLFEPKSVKSISGAILSFFLKSKEEKEIIQKKCIEHSQKFNTDILLKRHLEVYSCFFN